MILKKNQIRRLVKTIRSGMEKDTKFITLKVTKADFSITEKNEDVITKKVKLKK